MSATLQRAWLEKSPEARSLSTDLPKSEIPATDRVGHLWDDVKKPLQRRAVKDTAAIAQEVIKEHREGERRGPTLVIVNTVNTAVDIFKSLQKNKSLSGVDLRLIHSRFRPHERAIWRESFLNRHACEPTTDRIIIATQVVEAGVDISAGILVTELAPWPSLVQRFGRAARWGGTARMVVVDREPKDDKASAPYPKDELDAAREALGHLQDGSPLALEEFEEQHQELVPALYPYAPKHMLLSHELDDLFDTTPDLSGADIDISRFIRSGDERDLQVFWQEVPEDEVPSRRLRPSREALCSVPFLQAQVWLCEKAQRLKRGMRAWVWDWLDGEWRRAERRDLYPGQTVLVDARCGGYDVSIGWDPATDSVSIVPPAKLTHEELADAAQDDEELSAYAWQTIAVHGSQVGREASALATRLCPGFESTLELAGRWHDAGKAHEAFQKSIVNPVVSRADLAKAPMGHWLSPKKLYPDEVNGRRAGFRHELASTLALFAVLIRHAPDHAALLGPWKELLAARGISQTGGSPAASAPNSIECEVLGLSSADFELLAYLVCCHHGKVRCAWHASPADQQAEDDVLRIRGVREGDLLPSVLLSTSKGEFEPLPESSLTLAPAAVGLSPITGRSWTDRVLGLLNRHSIFELAFLEALLRVADIRASKDPCMDPLLGEVGERQSLRELEVQA